MSKYFFYCKDCASELSTKPMLGELATQVEPCAECMKKSFELGQQSMRGAEPIC